jgi:hypothetical protein
LGLESEGDVAVSTCCIIENSIEKGIADRRRAAKSALADGGPRWISFSIIY